FFGERNHLQQDVELVLYRCAYELVNNVMKHAAAARIDIQLIQQSGSIILTVSDNGKGFDVSQETKGMGLQNIRARIARYQGRMEIISHMGEGTEINVTIPL
ncbi:sensor histidine kinase, partial [Bacteroides heparinolyticus]